MFCIAMTYLICMLLESASQIKFWRKVANNSSKTKFDKEYIFNIFGDRSEY